jgi:ribonuclease D
MSELPKSPRASHARHAFRSRHRAQSHASAHAEADHAKPHAILEHPLVSAGAAQVVTTDDALSALIKHVREMGCFAYDSEFIGELTYHPRLCLLQVATTQLVALIDPLAPIELRPFWEVLADPSIEKIVHAGEQDVEPVWRLIGRPFANVFDTQIAAGFVALAYPVALSKLVQHVIGARLGKGLTFTHWDQRPLSAVQLRYAADDVRYLPAVRDAIGKRLHELGHAAWAHEECQALCDPRRHEFDPESDFLRLRGAGSLSRSGLAILRQLMIWRDGMARASDVPPRAYLRDEILVDMARHPPKTPEKLSRIRHLPRPLEEEHGAALVELVTRAAENPLNQAPEHAPEPTPAERFRADSLWALVQSICLGRSIDPNIVASRQDVSELDRLLSRGADTAQHKLMRGWRRDAVGEKLLDVIQRGGRLNLKWEGNSMHVD